MSKVVSILAREVPLKLRNNFKAFCATNEVSMSEALIVLMRLAIKKDLQIKLRVTKYKKKKEEKVNK